MNMELSREDELSHGLLDESIFESVGISPLQKSSPLPDKEFVELLPYQYSESSENVQTVENPINYLFEDSINARNQEEKLTDATTAPSSKTKSDFMETDKTKGQKHDVLSRITSITLGHDFSNQNLGRSLGNFDNMF